MMTYEELKELKPGDVLMQSDGPEWTLLVLSSPRDIVEDRFATLDVLRDDGKVILSRHTDASVWRKLTK